MAFRTDKPGRVKIVNPHILSQVGKILFDLIEIIRYILL